MEFKHEALQMYQNLGKLGEGAQGTVYKVKKASGRRFYALKILNEKSDPELFRKEIEALKTIEHKNIIRMHEFSLGGQGQEAFILMNYMQHGTILDYLKKNKATSIQDKLLFIQDIGKALRYIHEQDLSHRDVKPHNIFLTNDSDGSPYACLGDFGVVKNVAKEATETVGGKGTPIYLPLEVLLGKREYSKKDDIYGLGMSMYEILTGRHPYGNFMDYVKEVSSDKEIVEPSIFSILIDIDINQICLKSIAKNSQDRYNDINLFLKDLNTSLNKYFAVEQNKKKDEQRIRTFESDKIEDKIKEDYSPLELKIDNICLQSTAKNSQDNSKSNLFDSEEYSFFKEREQIEKQRAKEFESTHQAEKELRNIKQTKKILGMNAFQKLYEKFLLTRAEVHQDIWAMLRLARLYLKANERTNEAINKVNEFLTNYEIAGRQGHTSKEIIELDGLSRYGKYVLRIDNYNDYTKGDYYQFIIDNRFMVNDRLNKAIAYYEAAAERGSAIAAIELAELYLHGRRGVQKDNQKAENYYFRVVIENSSVKSARKLGDLYFKPMYGFRKDYDNALFYYKFIRRLWNRESNIKQEAGFGNTFRKMVLERKEDVDLLYKIGFIHEKGSLRRDPDYENAKKHYIEAIKKKGCVRSILRLARFYTREFGYYDQGDKAFELYKKVLKKSNGYAEYKIGELFAHGEINNKVNFTSASYWFRESIKKGEVKSLSALGKLYEIGGYGTEKSNMEAARYYKKGVIQGDEESLSCLLRLEERKDQQGTNFVENLKQELKVELKKGNEAVIFSLGLLCKKNKQFEEARDYLSKAIDNGVHRGLLILGDLYKENGDGIEAVNYYEKALDYGYDEACREIGKYYELGATGIERDFNKVIEYYSLGANVGDKWSIVQLAHMYRKENYPMKSYNQAARYYLKSLKRREFTALFLLKNLYLNDHIKDVVFNEGIEWLEEQVKKKDGWATCELGHLYERGDVFGKDCKKALDYYRKGMEYGEPHGAYRLGLLYEEGKGVEKNTVQAKRYYEKAVEGGCFDAYCKLGNFYMVGEGGVEKNLEKARECYEKASLRGYAFIEANRKLKELKKIQEK